MRKSFSYIAIFCVALCACRRARVTELKPYGESAFDSTQVLLLEDKYPYMKLVTDNVVHLQVQERESGSLISVSADDLIEPKVRFLPLETTEDCLVGGRVAKLESDDSSIFIFDRDNHQVLRFSQQDGSFLNKIGKRGRGPGEYGHVVDMSLNRKDKEVCLIDQGCFKFIYYNYDGQLLREAPLYYFYSDVEFVGDYMAQHTGDNANVMAPSVNNMHLVLAKQSDQSPEYVGFPFAEKVNNEFHYANVSPLITCNEDVYYTHLLSDTIWQVKPNGTCEARYVFKFPGRDNLFGEDDFMNMTDEQYRQKIEDASSYYDGHVRITKNFVHASMWNAKDMLYCIPTGNCRYGVIAWRGFGDFQKLYDPFILNGESFVVVLQPFDVLAKFKKRVATYSEESKERFMNEQLTEDERQLLSKMTPEDNPVLMIVDIDPF